MVVNDVAADLPGNPEMRKQPADRPRLPESAGFLMDVHPAVQEQLQAASDLPAFLSTAGKLTLADRQCLVEQALVLLEMMYVHLPMKRSMYAVDPIQRLKLLRYRMSEITEDQLPDEIAFHNEMTDIFTSTRDLHTNYLLPAPFKDKTAFLPFYVEEYYEENGNAKYLVSKVMTGFNHPTFQPGVEIRYWNGMPIRRAIEVNANRQAGSNPEARFARGLDSLTIRPLVRALPPDEEWVVIGYRSLDGQELELKQDWLVFSPATSGMGVNPNSMLNKAASLAIDIQTDVINTAKKNLYAPDAVAAEEKVAENEDLRVNVGSGLSTSMPSIFRAKVVDTDQGKFGYIRIFSFNVYDPDQFLNEFIRLIQALPQNGLIIDVRNNGGGLVHASEGLLQLFTPHPIVPESTQFINSMLTLNLCRQHAPSKKLDDFDLSLWVDSIANAVTTGATYSLAFPITDAKWCNEIGQMYHGPVLLITDALCYSATDIFAAGFQDHNIGPILGTSANTGAGGANVWTHELLSQLLDETESPLKPLPNGAGMRVAVRRTLRNGSRAGYPLEDLGVAPNEIHQMTKNDLLHGNVDLINRAASILAKMPVYQLSAKVTSHSNGKIRVRVNTANITRLDIYLDGRPQESHDIQDGTMQLVLAEPQQGANLIEIKGYLNSALVAARKLRV